MGAHKVGTKSGSPLKKKQVNLSDSLMIVTFYKKEL